MNPTRLVIMRHHMALTAMWMLIPLLHLTSCASPQPDGHGDRLITSDAPKDFGAQLVSRCNMAILYGQFRLRGSVAVMVPDWIESRFGEEVHSMYTIDVRDFLGPEEDGYVHCFANSDRVFFVARSAPRIKKNPSAAMPKIYVLHGKAWFIDEHSTTSSIYIVQNEVVEDT